MKDEIKSHRNKLYTVNQNRIFDHICQSRHYDFHQIISRLHMLVLSFHVGLH